MYFTFLDGEYLEMSEKLNAIHQILNIAKRNLMIYMKMLFVCITTENLNLDCKRHIEKDSIIFQNEYRKLV